MNSWEFSPDTFISYMMMFALTTSYPVMLSASYASCPMPSRFHKMQKAYMEKALLIFWCAF
jgi:hypothetical protein